MSLYPFLYLALNIYKIQNHTDVMKKYRLTIDFYGSRNSIYVYARNADIAIRKAKKLYPLSLLESGNIRVIHR